MTPTTLFLESVAGIAGDMFVAACLDAGLVDADDVRRVPQLLGLDDVEVVITRVPRATVEATHVEVRAAGEAWKAKVRGHDHGGAGEAAGADGSHEHVPEHGQAGEAAGGEASHEHTHDHDHPHDHGGTAGAHHWHTHYSDLVTLLERSDLDERTKEFAHTVFKLLAEAEAKAHGLELENVAFHEVGAVDSIVDVAMAGLCVSRLSPGRVVASPIKLGRGTVRIHHGTHPIPPPASAHLSLGCPVAEVPSAIDRVDVELSTPTGLAILKALGPSFVDAWPGGTVKAQGMGAGSMDLGAYPNIFRVVVFEDGGEPAELPYDTDRVVEISCNLDDETPERTGWLMEKLLGMGALDGWANPVVGKKSRPAVCLSVLVRPTGHARFVDFILRNSSTFGVRYTTWERYKLVRSFEQRRTERGAVTFVVGRTTDGEVVKEKPEYEEMRLIWEEDPGFAP